MTERRDFIKKSIIGTAGIAIGGMGFSAKSYASIMGANDRIDIAVIGIRSRGGAHINAWCDLKDRHWWKWGYREPGATSVRYCPLGTQYGF